MIIKECSFETVLIDSRYFRKGILLTLTNQSGEKTTTEISPLPGFSQESLEEAGAQLKRLKQKILTTWWTTQSLHYLEGMGLYPSVHFAVPTALLDLLDPVATNEEVPCYALLIGSPTEIHHRAEEAYKEGFRHAKMKLGHLDSKTAHSLVSFAADKFSLRLDFNRKWSLQEATEFCSHYPLDQFEYIEEPTSNPKDLLTFSHPYALDESLREIDDLKPYLASPQLKALIIKPTMHFPFIKYLNLGPKVVLTSSFESPIGIAQIKRWIKRLHLTKIYHGLDSLRYFDKTYDHLSDQILASASP